MNRTSLFRVGAFALATVASAMGLAVPAAAQTGCSDGGGGFVSVSIDHPSAGDTVSGTIVVQGTARASVGLSIGLIQVSFGGKSQTHQYPSSPSELTFRSPFDTDDMSPGEKEITVVACQTGIASVLAWGTDSISVNVEGASAPTTSGNRSPTSLAAPVRAPGATPTTVVPTSVGSASSTTVASSVPTTEPRVDVFKPEPVKPKSAADAPLILTETPARPNPRPPLWVGAVVGISGAGGLAFSAASWRRRTHPPETAEPLDPDLVEVG